MSKLKIILVWVIFFVLILAVIRFFPDGGEQAAWDRIENRKNERYEKMLKTEGMNILNKETLEKDHEDCVETYKDNVIIQKHSDIEEIVVLILISILIFYSMMVQNPNHPIKKIVVVAIIFIYGMMMIVVSRVDGKYLDEPYKYVEENIKIKKEASREFILCTDDGRELEVEEHLYDRVDGAGKYYLAETESGVVLNLYPAEKFILEK